MVEVGYKGSLVFVEYLGSEVSLGSVVSLGSGASLEFVEYLEFLVYLVHFCFHREEILDEVGVGEGHVFSAVLWTSLSTCGQGC